MQKKKIGHILFTAAVMGICVLPTVVMPWQKAESVGNEQLAELPELLDEDGKENTFEHILTFMYEGKKYVALSPIADEESAMDDDEAEVVLFQITSENGEDTYVSIDNEVLLDEVFAEFLDLMDEINEEEEKE